MSRNIINKNESRKSVQRHHTFITNLYHYYILYYINGGNSIEYERVTADDEEDINIYNTIIPMNI